MIQPGNAWNRFADWLAGLTGNRRWIAASSLGLFSAAALPPLYILPAIVVAFSGLFWLVEASRRPRDALWVGWFFGFGHFIGGFYWIGSAFLVEAERFAWLMPFAVGALCMGMALYPAIACWAARYCGQTRHHLGAALIGFWVVAEWIRGHALTGFPWNPIGHVLAWSDSLVQLAAVTGVWGVSLLAVACAITPALLALDSRGKRRCRWPAIGAYMILSMVAVGGAIRLAAAQPPGEEQKNQASTLRIVQANIPQAEKWQPQWRQRNIALQLALSQADWRGDEPVAKIDAVIWPETAFPYWINTTAIPLLESARPAGGWLILGGVRSDTNAYGERHVWNSLLVIGEGGEITATYDKTRLVPFGEYVPLADWLPINALAGGFSAGPGPATIQVPGLPAFSPFICYEVIFPGMLNAVTPRPQWLLNVTNDAWFGVSSGPYQHLASARLRAVEEGLALVRAANTGISAVIDPYGRITAQLPLGERGLIDTTLPPSLAKTLYAQFGDWMVAALLLALILYGLIARHTD